ncbi:DUF4352 domain-containing protein [Brevibacterium sp.]|uniref:DUF4352 domain-containing protein n=1 Tax=Brevibacterium sp. TaxID=1701 RepID=UPI0028113B83|nr:DUF4352 domain-containing protein [Brevibacterium sp.]
MSNSPGPQQSGNYPHNPQQAQPTPGHYGPPGQAGPQQGQTQWAPAYAQAGSGPVAPHYGGQMGQPPMGQPQKPVKQKKPLLKRWWVWAIIIVLLIVIFANLGGGGGDETADSASTSATEEKGEAKDAPAAEEPVKEEAPAEYGMGEAVTADGWEITVNEVEDGVSTIGNEFLNTKAQGQFVTVNLSVKNTGSSAELFWEDNIKLTDEAGNTYSSDSEAGIYAEEESALFLEEINPGNTAEGVLVFDVPKDVAPSTLVLEGGLFSEPVEITLK